MSKSDFKWATFSGGLHQRKQRVNVIGYSVTGFSLKQRVLLGSVHLLWTHIATWSSVTYVSCHVAAFPALGSEIQRPSHLFQRQWRLKYHWNLGVPRRLLHPSISLSLSLPPSLSLGTLIPPRSRVKQRGADIKGCVSPLRVQDQSGRGRKRRNETRRGAEEEGEEENGEEKLFWGKDLPYCSRAEGADERRRGGKRRGSGEDKCTVKRR